MMTITHDEDEIKKARVRKKYLLSILSIVTGDGLSGDQVAKELSKLSREERLKLRFQVLLEDMISMEEELQEMEAYRFIEFIGQDEQNRTVVLLTVANVGMVGEQSSSVYLVRYL